MSTYTGKVSPGEPADVRELAGLTISKISVGPTVSGQLTTNSSITESSVEGWIAKPRILPPVSATDWLS